MHLTGGNKSLEVKTKVKLERCDARRMRTTAKPELLVVTEVTLTRLMRRRSGEEAEQRTKTQCYHHINDCVGFFKEYYYKYVKISKRSKVFSAKTEEKKPFLYLHIHRGVAIRPKSNNNNNNNDKMVNPCKRSQSQGHVKKKGLPL